MKKSLLLGAGCIFLHTIITTSANAAVTYSYTGNNFNVTYDSTPPAGATYSGSQSISIEFTVASLITNTSTADVITPDTFTISDGVTTFTELSPIDASTFKLATNASGVILDWNISAYEKLFTNPSWTVGEQSTRLLSYGGEDSSYFYECATVNPDSTCSAAWNDFGKITGSPGSWTITSVPIPAAVWLFGSGLVGLIGVARRKKAA